MTKEEDRKIDWQPLRELALKTPYTMEYLSLMARRKQLKVKKNGRLWYSTLRNIKEFEEEMKERKEKRREKMRNSYFKKSDKKGVTVKVSRGSIFDQIQEELQEVLGEIRTKEKRLREEYQFGITESQLQISNEISNPEGIDQNKLRENKIYLQKEKQETEELSEKLIMDLGKLLNTANQIQEDVKDFDAKPTRSLMRQEKTLKNKNRDEYSIPIRNRINDIASPSRLAARPHPIPAQSKREFKDHKKQAIENHTPFLSLNYPPYQGEVRGQYEISRFDNQDEPAKKGKWLKVFVILLIGFLIFISIVLILFLLYEG